MNMINYNDFLPKDESNSYSKEQETKPGGVPLIAVPRFPLQQGDSFFLALNLPTENFDCLAVELLESYDEPLQTNRLFEIDSDCGSAI